MVSRSQEVSTDSEQILHDTVNRREPLELSGRLETPHLALTLSGRLMGDLRAVIRVLIGAVKHRRHHRATGGRVTAQLVGDQASRHLPLVLQQLAKESIWSFSAGRMSMSGSPKITNRFPLPVFFRLSAMWRSAFILAFSTGMRPSLLNSEACAS